MWHSAWRAGTGREFCTGADDRDAQNWSAWSELLTPAEY